MGRARNVCSCVQVFLCTGFCSRSGVEVLGFRVKSLGFRVWGLELRVQGLGFRV